MVGVAIYEARSRKRRSDFGTSKTTVRDLVVLEWIGEQYAISGDHLQELLTRESERKKKIREGKLSPRAVRWVLQRWENNGWIERRKLLVEQPQWIWLTKKGLKTVGLNYKYMEPSVSRLNHIWYVNAVRLHVERKKGSKAHWVSERQVMSQREGKRGHLVDSEVIYQDTQIATEVELVQKSAKRLKRILWGLKRDYQAVWYFVAEDCYTALATALKSVDRKGETFVVYRLADILR